MEDYLIHTKDSFNKISDSFDEEDRENAILQWMRNTVYGIYLSFFKKGDIVKGVVIKFNKHGALASINEGVAGLVHISEFANEEKMKEALSLGKVYDFAITFFEPKEQRMTLTYISKE